MFKKLMVFSLLFLSQQIMPSLSDDDKKKHQRSEETESIRNFWRTQSNSYSSASAVSSPRLGAEPFLTQPLNSRHEFYPNPFSQRVAPERLSHSSITTEEFNEINQAYYPPFQSATAEELTELTNSHHNHRPATIILFIAADNDIVNEPILNLGQGRSPHEDTAPGYTSTVTFTPNLQQK